MLPWLWRRIDPRARPHSASSAPPILGGDATPEAVYHAAALHFLDVQISTNDVLDNKAANAFSIGITVLSLTFGLLSIGQRDVPGEAEILLFLALMAYLVLVVFAWRASQYRALEYRPDIATLELHSRTFPADALTRWVADEHTASIEENRHVLVKKARWVGATNTALYAEGLLLSAAAIATLLL